ncbi:MAG: hypothetical protein COC06_06175 [Bacteroidales bacterium]|nr:MAG: hypothetical protein COC06_06175 [Bacteroidales bacterium]
MKNRSVKKTTSVYLYLQLIFIILCLFGCTSNSGVQKIDREKLVLRHQVHVNSIDTLSSLTVGNGKFAFTVDFTGLQSFPDLYEKGIPLGTQSEWGWHSFPNKEAYTFDESLKNYDFHGREVPYAVQWETHGRNRDAANYFRQNPHRLHLGVVGFDFFHKDGSSVAAEEVSSINQTLNPWNGEIHSSFEINGIPVEVSTYVHQDLDQVSSRINSPLIKQGLIQVKLHFPYPSGEHTDSGCDWNLLDKHESSLTESLNSALIQRQIDSTSYFVKISWQGQAKVVEQQKHSFYLQPKKGQDEFSFSCLFSPTDTVAVLPNFETTALSSQKTWEDFWLSGGAVDFSGSTDPRAFELERRVVLSQYLTKVQCTGSFPPQETGLTYNSWYGKFHLEMHWWHAVHFALWNRPHLLEKSLDWYNHIANNAEKNAIRQGFDGLRWPKMTNPSGDDSPSSVGSFLIWQQPHFIYLAELCYRNSTNEEILRKYADLVFETADFMASYACFDTLNNRYVLGPTLIPAQERLPLESTINPPFELAYWYWGLTTAQKWRERLSLDRNPAWDVVLDKLSPLTQKDGLYLAAESAPDSYTNPQFMTDHPMVLGAYGMLPDSRLVDSATMKKTFDYVWENWHWHETWGWDFPMTAMVATRLKMPHKALDALFMNVETNTYLPNGHNYQNKQLRLYLPGNGGLLTAVAMMCAGYDGSEIETPGFPQDSSWQIKWEYFKKLP